ncbi:hypothetical protein [Ekhidna sp.]|uniref:hypothetical protein n=1 Tax=Ekhidna sp. TaxID=2608089 RepID=UPI003BA9E79B
MKPLQIPKRYRQSREGMYVRCNKRCVNVTDKCCLSGKKLHTCKYGDKHQFLSKVYDPVTGKMKHGKSWPKDLRDFTDFQKLHLELKKQNDKSIITINEKPGLLTQCMKMYAAWIKDIDVPTYERKNNTEHYTRGEIRHLKNLKEALASKEVNADYLVITEFNKKHVEIIYDYLTGRFSNKSFNHQLATYRRFFAYLIDLEYPLVNHFKKVKPLPTKAKKEVVSIEEFKKLCSIVTPEAGVKFKSKKEGGKTKVFRAHLYTDYLINGWAFELYTGCRYEEIQTIKVKDIKEDHIATKDHKASRKKKEDVIRLIPMIDELRDLCARLSKGSSPDDYLIAPKETNRKNVTSKLSVGFTHYWAQVSDRKDVTFYSLKNSYATEMVKRFGDKVNLHLDFNTTMKNYVNELELIKTFNVPLYG